MRSSKNKTKQNKKTKEGIPKDPDKRYYSLLIIPGLRPW